MGLIAAAVPAFLLAIALEWLWGRYRGRDTYRLNDALSSLSLGGLSQARRFVALGVGGAVYAWLSAMTPLPVWPADSWLVWVVAFVLYDLCYYASHRMGHEVTLFWAAHVVHHQSEDYNLSTALRQTSSGFLVGWIFYTPLFFAGIPAEVVVTVGALNLIYQFWVHTEHVGELGWFEYVFVSPSNHRVHHARNPCYLDKNYGGVFIVWDRLFGTYQRELGHEPCIYGITTPIQSFSPLVAWLHVYRDMARNFMEARDWRQRLWVPLSHPSWQPDGTVATGSLDAFQKFDPQVSAGRKLSAIANVVLITVLLVVAQQMDLTTLQERMHWVMMLWLGVANAALLSGVNTRLFTWQEVLRAIPLFVLASQWPLALAAPALAAMLLALAWLVPVSQRSGVADATPE